MRPPFGEIDFSECWSCFNKHPIAGFHRHSVRLISASAGLTRRFGGSLDCYPPFGEIDFSECWEKWCSETETFDSPPFGEIDFSECWGYGAAQRVDVLPPFGEMDFSECWDKALIKHLTKQSRHSVRWISASAGTGY